jgi:hypothetical protein
MLLTRHWLGPQGGGGTQGTHFRQHARHVSTANVIYANVAQHGDDSLRSSNSKRWAE